MHLKNKTVALWMSWMFYLMKVLVKNVNDVKKTN